MISVPEASWTARPAFLTFLHEELAPRPGRVAAIFRISFCCTLIVAIAMLYQIPIPAYMAYIVFLASREEAASTLLLGVLAGLAATLAVMLSVLFYVVDASEPALRLPLMAVSTFLGMFLLRTMKLGQVAFLASFVLVLSQTLIDVFPTLEALTRFVLWLWVVALLPDVVTVLVNLAIGENPARLARRTALRLLGDLAASLRSGNAGKLQTDLADAVGLVELRQRAAMLDRGLRGQTDIDTMLIETLAELFTLHRLLPADTPIEARLPLSEACDASAAAFERGAAPVMLRPARPADAVLAALSPQARPIVVAMAEAMTRLSDGIAARRTSRDVPAVPAAKSLFVPDAFSNPDHARFALKTTIAVMAVYIAYSILDWPGLRTSVTTCFFVALGSFGETMHKLTLRLAGALLGGIIGGLSIVFILPQMDDIGQLCLLIAAVSALSAWVATASDRLSYAGMQMAFAFFLGVLQGYGPSTDLTVLRDRVIGILLGNVAMSVVFSVLWPTSAADRAWSSMAAALRALGRLLTDRAGPGIGTRLAAIRALGQAQLFVAVAAFELRMLPARQAEASRAGLSVASLHRLAGASFAVVDQPHDADITEDLLEQDAAAAAWFVAYADRRVTGKAARSAAEPFPAFDPAGTRLPADPSLTLRAAIEARALLQAEVEHAVAAAP